MDVLVVSSAGTKKSTQKILQPVQLLQFKVVVTGDFATGSPDLVAKFHEQLSTAILTVNKRNADGSISDIINQRPLDEVLNVDAIATRRTIKLNGTLTELTINGAYDLGNDGSIFANQSQYIEVTLDLGAAANQTATVTGFSADYANPGHKKLEVVSCLASQATEFPVEPNHARIALPSTVTRLLLKSSAQCDQDLSKEDLQQYLRDSNGMCFIANGLVKESTNWFVFPYSTRSTKSSVTLSVAGVVYVVKVVA